MIDYRKTSSQKNITLSEALLYDGQPTDDITVACRLPMFPKAVLANLPNMSLEEIAYIILSPLVGTEVTHSNLNQIIKSAFSNDFSLQTDGGIYRLQVGEGGFVPFSYTAKFYTSLTTYFTKVRNLKYIVTRKSLYLIPYLLEATQSTANKVIAVIPHQLLDIALRGIKGSTRNLGVITLNGSQANRDTMLSELLCDRNWLQSNDFVITTDTNVAHYLTCAVVFFAIYAKLLAYNPQIRKATIVVDHFKPLTAMAAAVANAIGLNFDIRFLTTDISRGIPSSLAKAFKLMNYNPDNLFVTEEEKNRLESQTDPTNPVVIITTRNPQHENHRAWVKTHNAHNTAALKKEIVSIK